MLSSRQRTCISALLAIGAGLAVVGWFYWLCVRSPGVKFLARHAPAEWIVYSTPPDGIAHPIREGKTELVTVFRRSFDAGPNPASAKIQVRALGHFAVNVNGKLLGAPSVHPATWKDSSEFEIGSLLRAGTNLISVTVTNRAGPPLLWAALSLGGKQIATDASWECSCSEATWKSASLATSRREIQPGNGLYGGEAVWRSIQGRWMSLLSIALVAVGVAFSIRKWSQTAEKGSLWLAMGLVFVWIALAVNNIGSIPITVGFDSRQHLNYIGYILEEHSLPLADEGYEMHQPPLYYVLSALSLGLFSLPANTTTAINLLRTETMFLGIAQILLVWTSLRLLFPAHPRRQMLGVFLAGCLPAHIIISHYITNETTLAVFVSATLYLLLRIVVANDRRWFVYAGLGVCLGAALLSKITAFLVVPWVFLALVWDLARMKEWRVQAWGRALGIVGLACVVVSGWHYVRVWQEFGNPLGWHRQWSYGSGWWQENGYQTADYYVRFGDSLKQPFYSAMNSFADGVYSTLWGEGLYNGIVQTSERPPWNYDLMSPGYLLALLPMFGIVAGIFLALWKFFRQPSIPWAVFLGLFFSFGVAMVYNSLQVPGYGAARASFGLLTLLPLCAFAALGLDALLGWRSWLRFPVMILLITWALVAVSSLWVSKQGPAKFLQVRTAMDAKLYARAAELAQTYLKSNPNAVQAQLLYTDALFRMGQTNQALVSAQRYADAHPGSALAFLDLSSQLAEQRQLDHALVNARRAVELAPENFPVRYHLAKILLEQQKFSEAAEAARECLRLKPWDTEARAVLEKARDSLPK